MFEQLYRQREELIHLINRSTTNNGTIKTLIPSLFLSRYEDVTGPHYGIYKTSLCIIVQGAKEVLVADRVFSYGPANYFVASINMPITGQVTEATKEKPYLALKIEFTADEIVAVLRDFQVETEQKKRTKQGMYVSKLHPTLLDAVTRLVRLLDHPEEIAMLAPLIKKEIIYRILQSENGSKLQQIAVEGSAAHQVNEAIHYILRHYETAFKIENLADLANMSVSSLHRHFKEVTMMTPIQFQKQLRLQKARNLLLTQSADAADVAFRVGYESPSQFSREYTRLFGRPPKEDVKYVRHNDKSIDA